MENNVFIEPAVAGVLTKNYVEARLHTDSHDDLMRPLILEQQLELQGGIGLPYYIVMEPNSRRKLADFNRVDKALLDSNVFKEFLEDGVEQANTLASNR